MNIIGYLKRLLPAYRLKQNIDLLRHELNVSHKHLETLIKQLNEKNEYLFWLSMQRENEPQREVKKRIMRSLPPANGELRLIQLSNNFILQRIKKICDENDIRLMLDYGTLLGAVRHSGFIPWDDDIDVVILRKDVDRFASLIRGDGLLSLETYYGWYGLYAVRKVKFASCPNFWVDIWVCDTIPVDDNIMSTWEKTFALTNKYMMFLQDLIVKRHGVEIKNKNAVTDPVIDKEIKQFTQSIFNDNPWYSGQDAQAFCLGFDNAPHFRTLFGIVPFPTDNPILKNELVFEGQKYDVISCYDKKLQQMYGDYWGFPQAVTPNHSSEIGHLTTEQKRFLSSLGITLGISL